MQLSFVSMAHSIFAKFFRVESDIEIIPWYPRGRLSEAPGV